MTGLESIIKCIEEEAAFVSKERILAAEKKVEELKEEARKEEEKLLQKGEKEREILLHNSRKQADSAALVAKKNKILAAKQKLIMEVILQAKESILSLPNEEYFNLILKLLAPFELEHDGRLCFNQRDLNRLPSDFLEALDRRNEQSKENKLTIAKEPVNITGGFLLEQENITHNLSLEALFDEKRDQLLEPIASLLFKTSELACQFSLFTSEEEINE